MSRLKIPRPKKFVLVRMKTGGNMFVLDRPRWENGKRMKFYRGAYEAEVVAEADEMLTLMRFKDLTKES